MADTPETRVSDDGFCQVTMPIHAFHGRRLRVIRFHRKFNGRREVDVEHPMDARSSLRLPIEWTDLASPLVLPVAEKRAPRLSPRSARALAASVAAVLDAATTWGGSERASVPSHSVHSIHEQGTSAVAPRKKTRQKRSSRARVPPHPARRVGVTRVQRTLGKR